MSNVKYRQFVGGKFHYWGFLQDEFTEKLCFVGPITNQIANPTHCQFTGLTDKNGVEIYEGDIIKDHSGIAKVDYSERFAAFRANYTYPYCKWFYDYNLKVDRESIEVIGNIYENQEILK